MNRIIIILVVMMLLSMNVVSAAPINYTFTGTATGNVDSAVFSNTEVTITVSADTENVLFDGINTYYVISSLAIIDIAGIGSGTFTRETSVFNLQASNYSFAGFQQDNYDIVIVEGFDLANYDLKTSLGPLSYGYLSNVGLFDIPTTIGTVVFHSYGDFTFQAEVQDVECIDTDNDGIEDCVDYCPYEDSTGLDADSDGCIDSFSGLSDTLQTLFAEGLIDNTLENMLTKQVINAQAKANKDNICAAVNKLENALIGALNAQKGKKIFPETAAIIIQYTNNLISQLLYLLPLGKTC